MSPNTFPRSQKTRHGPGYCFVWALGILVLLLIGVSMGWFFVIRPSIHNTAQTELNAALDRAEGDIHPPSFFLPGIIVPIQEHTITELFVLNLAPSDPIKNPVTHIIPNNIRLDFELYGFPCAISAVPQADNGHLVVSNVNIEGIISFIMSPDEMTTLLNKHLMDAQARFQHSVSNVQLKDHEMDLTFQ